MKFSFYTIIVAGVVAGVCAAGAAYVLYAASDSRFTEEPVPGPEAGTETLLSYWNEAVREYGGKEAYQRFADAYGALDVQRQHALAHVFGEALYKQEGISGVAVCDSNYSFGCYHAFFGWALADQGLSILEELDQECIKEYGRKGLGCQHGIGHGVIAELGYDKLAESLEACMRLDWQDPIGGCTSGVFMEFNFNTMQQWGTRQLDERGEHYPCTEVPDRFTQACYFEQPAWWSMREGDDYAHVGALCEEVTDAADREACYRGTGNVIAGLTKYNIEEMQAACGEMPDSEGEFLCIEGATWIVSNQEQFKDVWQQLCEPYSGQRYKQCMGSHDLI